MISLELVYDSRSFSDYISVNVKLIFKMKLNEINKKIINERLTNRENSL